MRGGTDNPSAIIARTATALQVFLSPPPPVVFEGGKEDGASLGLGCVIGRHYSRPHSRSPGAD